MRVLIVAHGFPPREPGVWTYHHAQELSGRHSVWVYARAGDPTRREYEQWEERDAKVTVRRVNRVSFDPFRHFDTFRSPIIDEQFLGFVDEVGPDVVHFEHIFGLSATMLAGARRRGLPVVLSLYDYWLLCQRVFLLREDATRCPGPSHDFDCVTCVEGPRSESAAVSRIGGDWRLLAHDSRLALMKEVFEQAAVVTACSASLQGNITRLLGVEPDRVRVVPLGVPPLAGPVARQTSERIRITYVGAVAPHKGVQVLAAAAKGCADLEAEVHLHGMVSDDTRASLLAINPSLTFHGAYSREMLPGILGRTDILVVPSLAAETYSFVVREAALANVAVIASRIGAIPDFIRDGETGLLVTPGSAVALTMAIRRLVQDGALRERLATRHEPIRTVQEYTAEMEEIFTLAIESQAGLPS